MVVRNPVLMRVVEVVVVSKILKLLLDKNFGKLI